MNHPSPLEFASDSPRSGSPTRGRRSPRQARAQVTREAILDATLQVLLRSGFAQLTTTRVAARAGVSVGTLYQYFADKDALIQALMERYLGSMRTAVDAAVQHAGSAPPEQVLRSALAALLEVKLARLDLVLALRAPLAQLDGSAWVRASLAGFAASFEPVVRRALGPEADGPTVSRKAWLAVSAIEGAIAAAASTEPACLSEPGFLDELTAIGAAVFRPPVAHLTEARSSLDVVHPAP